MKIGLVCPYNMFKGGGVQECVLALKQELKDLGHDVRIVTPKPRSVPESYDPEIILVGTATDVKSPFSTTAQISANVDSKALEKMLDQQKFDVLHFHEPWVPLLSWQILNRSQAAHVATFHAKLPESMMSRTIERVITPYTKSVLKSLHVLTAVSGAASEYVKSLNGYDPIIIPNGIDLKKYKPTRPHKSAQTKTILYVGRLERRKGVKYLLRAFADLAREDENVRLQIIGDGPDRQKLEAFVDDKKIPRVTFLGYVSEETKIQALQEADLFCSPAIFGESFGIVLLEAMAAGTVVVAGNNPGYSAVLKERGSLSIVNPRDIPEFARRLRVLLYDHEVRKMWLDWAKEYVKNFSYSKVAKEYEKTYKQASRDRTS